MAKIIIGIHGLLNKPKKSVLESWWLDAIAEGLQRNKDLTERPAFDLAYWADIRNTQPVPDHKNEEPYVVDEGTGPFRRYDPSILDKGRAVIQKWGGRVLDKEKELFGLGENVEHLIGIKFDDLADYYDNESIRTQMRARLGDLLQRHSDDASILVLAHSMGSIIAYDVLRTLDGHSTLRIKHFLTLGSPLGLPIVSHNIWEEFRKKQTPEIVEQWTNIADPGDKVALDCNLSDDYDANGKGVKVKDVLVHNDYRSPANEDNNHKSYGYLRTPEVSDVIFEFLNG